MTDLTTSTLSHIAKLSRINLTQTETDTYTQQLSAVFKHINNLNKVDTAKISPTFQVTGQTDVFQSKELATNCLDSKTVTSLAPKSKDNYIVTLPSIVK